MKMAKSNVDREGIRVAEGLRREKIRRVGSGGRRSGTCWQVCACGLC
jgi:hypothetical protein